MDYSKHVHPKFDVENTPQSEPIPGKDMKQNNAGGFTFTVNDWDRLDRFLVLGSEGGTYYVGEKTLTVDNAKVVTKLLHEDGMRVVERIIEISEAGRAPKNDPAIFALAMASAADDAKVRRAALNALPRVCRIGTHLFHFAQFVEAFRGWGRALRRAVGDWYNGKELDTLVHQLVKYKSRDGWSNRDLLRLSHPATVDSVRNSLYKWVVDSENADISAPELRRVVAAEQLSVETDVHTAVSLIQEFNLPREVVNTALLNSVEVWDALLTRMPLEAMIRNLGKMTSVGLLSPMSDASRAVVEALGDTERLAKARIHPLGVLVALNTYNSGRGVKGSLTWTPDQSIVDALDKAFYTAFKNVEPTNKRVLLALDVSGSMTCGEIAGMAGITPRIGSAAMAMVTAAVESSHLIKGFTAGSGGYYSRSKRDELDGFIDLNISPRMRLDNVISYIDNLTMGGTDCALPMVWALKNKVPVDAFVVYTDSETWAGTIQPVQALKQYRDQMGIPAKLIVVGMTATEFTIADPNDAGMLDVVGFDTAAPNVMSDFISK